MTPEQRSKLLSLIREYGEAEGLWARGQHRYLFVPGAVCGGSGTDRDGVRGLPKEET